MCVQSKFNYILLYYSISLWREKNFYYKSFNKKKENFDHLQFIDNETKFIPFLKN